MDKLTGQKVNIKFLVKLGKTLQVIHEMLSTVYEDNTLEKTPIFKYIERQ